MPEYTIDTGLYGQALEQIKTAYLKEHPVSSAVSATVLPAIDEHAKYVFGIAWQGAVDMHEDNKCHRAQLVQQQLQPLDERRLSGLNARDQEKMRQRHMQLEQRMQERMDTTYKMMDDNNRQMFIALFANSGVERALAEKIVDEHILIHK